MATSNGPEDYYYYYFAGVSGAVFAGYDDCTVAADPFFEATIACDEAAIEAIGNPTITFDEFQDIYSGGEFDAAHDACIEEFLLVDTRIGAAAETCDVLVAFAYEDIDVLDESAIATATDTTLSDHSPCMRANGVANYPNLSATSNDDFSVLSRVAGSAVLIPSLDTVRISVERFGVGMLLGVPLLLLFLGFSPVSWLDGL